MANDNSVVIPYGQDVPGANLHFGDIAPGVPIANVIPINTQTVVTQQNNTSKPITGQNDQVTNPDIDMATVASMYPNLTPQEVADLVKAAGGIVPPEYSGSQQSKQVSTYIPPFGTPEYTEWYYNNPAGPGYNPNSKVVNVSRDTGIVTVMDLATGQSVETGKVTPLEPSKNYPAGKILGVIHNEVVVNDYKGEAKNIPLEYYNQVIGRSETVDQIKYRTNYGVYNKDSYYDPQSKMIYNPVTIGDKTITGEQSFQLANITDNQQKFKTLQEYGIIDSGKIYIGLNTDGKFILADNKLQADSLSNILNKSYKVNDGIYDLSKYINDVNSVYSKIDSDEYKTTINLPEGMSGAPYSYFDEEKIIKGVKDNKITENEVNLIFGDNALNKFKSEIQDKYNAKSSIKNSNDISNFGESGENIVITQDDLINYLIKNNNSKEAQETIKKAGYDITTPDKYGESIIDLTNKVIDKNNQLKDEIESVLKDNKEVSGKVQAIIDAMQQSDIYDNTKLGASLKPISKFDPSAGVMWVDDITGNILTDKDIALKIWDRLSDSEKIKVAGLYSNDLYKDNFLAEYTKQMGDIAEQGGIVGQLAYAPILGITSPIAKATTGQKVTALEIAGGIATGVADVLMMGGGSALSGLGKAGTWVESGLWAGVGTVGTTSTIQGALSKNPDGTRVMSNAELVVSSIMDILAFLPLGLQTVRGLKGSITEAEYQRQILSKYLEPNKNFISDKLIQNGQIGQEARIAYDNMTNSVHDYAQKMLEMKQAEKVVEDLGLAKNVKEESILKQANNKIKLIKEQQLGELENKAFQSIRSYNDIITKTLKSDDPLIYEKFKDTPYNALKEIDVITDRLAKPLKESSTTNQLVELRNLEDNLDIIVDRLKEIKEYDSYTDGIIKDIRNEINDLRQKLINKSNPELQGDYIQKKLIESNSKILKLNEELKKYSENSDERIRIEKEILNEKATSKAIYDLWTFTNLKETTDVIYGKKTYGVVIDKLQNNLDDLWVVTKKSKKINIENYESANMDILKAITDGDIKKLNESINKLRLETNNIETELKQIIDNKIKEIENNAYKNISSTDKLNNIDKLEKDILNHENELKYREEHLQNVSNPEKRSAIKENIEQYKKIIEQKKQDLKVLEKEKIFKPFEKTISPEEAEKLPKPSVIEKEGKYPDLDKLEEKLKRIKEEISSGTKKEDQTYSEPIIKTSKKENESVFPGVSTRTLTAESPFELPEEYTEPSPDISPSPLEYPFGIPKTKPEPTPQPVPEPMPEPQPVPEPMPEPQPVPEPMPEPTPQPEPSPEPIPIPEPQPKPIPSPNIVPEPTPSLKIEIGKEKGLNIPKLSSEYEIGSNIIFPPATLEWRQGMRWQVVPPRVDGGYYTEDMLSLDKPISGTTKFSTGKGSAYRTLQFVNGLPLKDANIDLGWAEIFVDAKKKTMTFKGGKEAIAKRWAEERYNDIIDREAYQKSPIEDITYKLKKNRDIKPSIPVNDKNNIETNKSETIDDVLYEIEDYKEKERAKKMAKEYHKEYPKLDMRLRENRRKIYNNNRLDRYYLGKKLRPTALGSIK